MAVFAVVVAGTLASYALGWLIGVPAVVPLLNAAAGWIVMAREIAARRVIRATAVMLVWAATMAISSTTMAWIGATTDDAGQPLFLRSGYRVEMIEWVRTGRGAESDPGVFVPQQIGSAAVFAAAAVGSGGVLAMPLGAVLTNSMGDYVGSLAARSARPVVTIVLGWHPWAVVRVIAFVILGVVLSAVLISRAVSVAYAPGDYRRWILAAIGMLVVDIALKWMLAPAWGRMLRDFAGW